MLSSHTQLSFTHSQTLSNFALVFLLDFCSRFDFKRPLSHFFAARKEKQLAGKNIHFGFTNVTRFELHVFLFHHERLRAEGLQRIQKDDGWKFIPFSGVAQAPTHPEPTPTPSTMDYEEGEQYEEMQAEPQAVVIEIDAEDAPYLDL